MIGLVLWVRLGKELHKNERLAGDFSLSKEVDSPLFFGNVLKISELEMEKISPFGLWLVVRTKRFN